MIKNITKIPLLTASAIIFIDSMINHIIKMKSSIFSLFLILFGTLSGAAQISGPTNVCPGSVVTYSIPNDPCFTNIEWWVPAGIADILGAANESEVVVQWNEPVPLVEVCVIYFDECLGAVNEFCETISIVEIPPTFTEESLCIGGCLEVGGQEFCTPGVFTVILESSAGCDSPVVMTIVPLPPVVVDLDTMLIPCEDSIQICGQTLRDPGPQSVYCEGNGVCDTIYTVFLEEDTVIAEAGDPPFVSCFDDVYPLFGTGSSTGDTYSYHWTSTFGSVVFGDSTLQPWVIAVGDWYYLTVTNDSTGCQAVDSVFVNNLNDPLSVFIEPTSIDCQNSEVPIYAALSGYSGIGTIIWTTVDGHIVSGENTLAPIINQPGEYCVEIYDFDTDCSAFACVNVSAPVNVIADAGASVFLACDGTAVTLDGSNSSTGPSIFYQWSADPCCIDSGANTLTPSVSQQGWYELIVTDEQSGCTDIDYVYVEGISIEIEPAAFTCDVEEITLQATITGPGGPYYYWTTTDGEILSGEDSLNPVIGSPGTYCLDAITPGQYCFDQECIFVPLDQNAPCSTIEGYVLLDENFNCLNDPGEMPLSDWLVAAVGSNGTFYGTTNADGFYTIPVGPGDYTVQLTASSSSYQICNNDVPANVIDFNTTVEISFSVFEEVDCPVMTVDIANNILRRCADNNFFYVNYCNEGTADASDASIEITLDPDLSMVFSPMPYTDLGGQVFLFEIGDVEQDECGDFWFQVMVDCDVEIAETHCTEAHIYPDQPCYPFDPQWSGASLEVRASCSDSTRFVVTNVGTAAITVPAGYIIIEDAVMYRPGTIQSLSPGASIEISLPANGATWRLELAQEPFHPFPSVPVAWMEGCGDQMNGTASRNFVNQYFLGDPELYLDTDCTQNQAPFDPNDKQGFPLGYSTEHFVKKENQIEYMIRFQNTGNDTARQVILLDTMDQKLDLTTLRAGASSHTYDYEIFGEGILKIEFPMINLPDSMTDLTGSQGFIQFMVSPKPDLLPGEVIYNQASIYFDQNPPIHTNTTFHTMEKPRVHEVENLQVCIGDSYQGELISGDTMLVENFAFPLYDSLHWTIIQALPSYAAGISATICEGDSYSFNGEDLTQSGTYQAALTSMNGCDSTETLMLEVLEKYETILFATTCEGVPVDFYGEQLFNAGVYEKHFPASNGCDSLIQLHLEVLKSHKTKLEAAVCEGEIYDFYGELLSAEGDYEAQLLSENGCDSIIILSLKVRPKDSVWENDQICNGETYDFNGTPLTTSGVYEEMLVNIYGCDSLVTLDLTVLEAHSVMDTVAICQGGSYWFDGQELENAGSYEANLINQFGCDSLVQLELEVKDVLTEFIAVSICEGETYPFGGADISVPGNYEATVESVQGCDSLISLTLHVIKAFENERAATLCAGDSAEMNGVYYYETGLYTDSLQSLNGCDSTFILDLIILDTIYSDITATICDNEVYDFNGEALNESGLYHSVFSSVAGCDSTVSLQLVVESSYADTLMEYVLFGEMYNGVIIEEDTVFTSVFEAANGCDSLVLTVVMPVVSTQQALAEAIDLKVYPNPSAGQFNLSFQLDQATAVSLEVSDVLGQSLAIAPLERMMNAGPQRISLDASDWPSGVYWIKMEMAAGFVVERMVIQR